MKIFNTLTRNIENFEPIRDKNVTMYTCGPTVYHYAHIGNLRTYITEDILEKTLGFLGYNVKRCMNITDVGHLASDSDSGEDKMLKGAKREKKSVMEIAEYYTNSFFDDCRKLNIKKPEIISPATANIDKYIEMITKLLEEDYAYISNGNIYFDVSKLNDYYILTNHKEDDLVVGARTGVEEDAGKKNQSDFVLWFTKSKFDDQELKWDSPWGYGYPGWHIECSAISLKYLGEHLDIHCGGVDNIFPHHTNEIAQTESYLGHKWCNYWVHAEHLNDATGKMSKSKGEFLTVSLLEEKGYSPLAYRFMCLQSHYRNQMVFTYDALDNAANAYEKLINKITEIKNRIANNRQQGSSSEGDLYKTKFTDALADDLNTSYALTILYDILKSDLYDTIKIELIEAMDNVFSLDLLMDKSIFIDEDFETYIIEMIEKRNVAKSNKNYELADTIRKELEEKNIVLKDTREGTTYEYKK